MSKIDNIFKKVITDEDLVNEYNISNPDQYTNISQGLHSTNNYVVAIATALKQLDSVIEQVKAEMRIRHKSDSVVIQEADYKKIYKKVITLLERTR